MSWAVGLLQPSNSDEIHSEQFTSDIYSSLSEIIHMKVSLLAKAQKQIFPGLMLGGIMGGEIPSDVASKHFCPSVNGQPVFML